MLGHVITACMLVFAVSIPYFCEEVLWLVQQVGRVVQSVGCVRCMVELFVVSLTPRYWGKARKISRLLHKLSCCWILVDFSIPGVACVLWTACIFSVSGFACEHEPLKYFSCRVPHVLLWIAKIFVIPSAACVTVSRLNICYYGCRMCYFKPLKYLLYRVPYVLLWTAKIFFILSAACVTVDHLNISHTGCRVCYFKPL